MMSKEIFAVVLLGLTGCFSVMALHTGNWPKNINKRQVVDCEISQGPDTVVVQESKVLSLTDLDTDIIGNVVKKALSAKEQGSAFSAKSERFEKVLNSDNYEVTFSSYNASSQTCTTPHTVTLEPIEITPGAATKAIFVVKGAVDDYLSAIITSCSSRYFWQFRCTSAYDSSSDSYDCPRANTRLDLFLVGNLDLSRYPMVKILDDLKAATSVEWGMPNYQWRANNENLECGIA